MAMDSMNMENLVAQSLTDQGQGFEIISHLATQFASVYGVEKKKEWAKALAWTLLRSPKGDTAEWVLDFCVRTSLLRSEGVMPETDETLSFILLPLLAEVLFKSDNAEKPLKNRMLKRLQICHSISRNFISSSDDVPHPSLFFILFGSLLSQNNEPFPQSEVEQYFKQTLSLAITLNAIPFLTSLSSFLHLFQASRWRSLSKHIITEHAITIPSAQFLALASSCPELARSCFSALSQFLPPYQDSETQNLPPQIQERIVNVLLEWMKKENFFHELKTEDMERALRIIFIGSTQSPLLKNLISEMHSFIIQSFYLSSSRTQLATPFFVSLASELSSTVSAIDTVDRANLCDKFVQLLQVYYSSSTSDNGIGPELVQILKHFPSSPLLQLVLSRHKKE